MIDSNTEILTFNGWRSYRTIAVGEPIPTYNQETGRLDCDAVSDVYCNQNYSGDVYSLHSKSIDMRVTGGHGIVHFGSESCATQHEPARRFSRRTSKAFFLRCGEFGGQVSLPVPIIKLLVVVAADGSIKEETQLLRVRIYKQRKHAYLRMVLRDAGVSYKELPQKDGGVCFHFYRPEILHGWSIKGLDNRLMEASREQFAAIVEAYQHSDGCKYSTDGVVIYSSKEVEINILQAAATQAGYGSTKYRRISSGGFSSLPGFQLSASPYRSPMCVTHLGKRSHCCLIDNEFFWCIETRNKNFFCRRDGRVHLTGNCHGE